MPSVNASSSALARIVTGVARAIAMTLAAALPALHYWSAHDHAHAEMQSAARLSASLLSEIVVRNPEVWRFEPHRLRGVLSFAAREGGEETWRLLDLQGRVLASTVVELAWPRLSRSEPVFDGTAIVARVEVSRSAGSILESTLTIMVLAFFSGFVAYSALRHIPMRLLAEALDRAAFLGLHDPLTGLPNRVLFTDRLVQALAASRRDGSTVALLCLDLDRFKAVNDTHGHLAGDAVLRTVTERFRAHLRDDDTIARLGGDEFAIILPGITDPGAPEHVARRLIAAVSDKCLVEQRSVSIGVSIGIAVRPVAPENGEAEAAEVMLGQADAALYQAKSDGRGTYCFYDAEMDLQLRARRAMEERLSQSLAAEEGFRLVFQPQFDLRSGALLGAEALIRWRDPLQGEVSPTQFIPIAEESGLIVAIGGWVLREACIRAAGWPGALRVAVNVSPMQFRHVGLEATVREVLAETGLDPRRLELEITESALLVNSEETMAVLRRLHALGVSIVMDDFGMGYSSLGHLQRFRFRFDKIKIDKSFIQSIDTDPQAGAIVQAVLGIGSALGVAVIAEGVETGSQARQLRLAGCDQVQGYLYSRPLEADAFLCFAEDNKRVPVPQVA